MKTFLSQDGGNDVPDSANCNCGKAIFNYGDEAGVPDAERGGLEGGSGVPDDDSAGLDAGSGVRDAADGNCGNATGNYGEVSEVRDEGNRGLDMCTPG